MEYYNEEQKARILDMIRAFQGARLYLPNAVASGNGICHAMYWWWRKNHSNDFYAQRGYMDARSLVSRSLGPCVYLEDWQDRNGFRNRNPLRDRERWITQLIADCKAALEE